MAVDRLTPAARRRLVQLPLGALGIHRYSTSYPWAGAHIADTVPEAGRRVWTVTPEDEELAANHREAED